MTREEAIEILNRDDDSMRKGYFCINDFKAIEVLKSEEPCKDAVNRKDVLDMIEQIQDAGGFIGYSTYSKAFDVVDNMPSVTPTQEPILYKIRAEIADLKYKAEGEVQNADSN